MDNVNHMEDATLILITMQGIPLPNLVIEFTCTWLVLPSTKWFVTPILATHNWNKQTVGRITMGINHFAMTLN